MFKGRNKGIGFLILFGAIFFIVGVAFIGNSLSIIRYFNISANGTEYVAIVDDIERSSGQYNDEYYGRAKVYYTDANGEEKEGYTSYYFKYHKAPKIGSSIKIKEYEGEIVESNFTPSAVYTVSTIISCVFGGVGLIIIIIGVSLIIKNIKHLEIVKKGTISKGKFIRATSNVVVNGVPMFAITFSFTGEYGQEKVTTTTSRYYADEAYKLELMRNFQICVYKDEAVITENLDLIDIMNLKQRVSETRKYCAHCGTENTENNLNCKNCGSNEFTNLNC